VTGPTSFGIVRFLLGVAEAGFFPASILYFTYWFPSYHHARIVSGFLVGLPVVGSVRRADIRSPLDAFSVCGAASHVHRRSDPNVVDRGDHVFLAHGSASGSKIPHPITALARQHIAAERRPREGATFTLLAGALHPKVLLLALNYVRIVYPPAWAC